MMNRFLADEQGATAIEYALLAALIAVTIIGGVSALSATLRTNYDSIASSVEATP